MTYAAAGRETHTAAAFLCLKVYIRMVKNKERSKALLFRFRGMYKITVHRLFAY